MFSIQLAPIDIYIYILKTKKKKCKVGSKIFRFNISSGVGLTCLRFKCEHNSTVEC